MLFRICAVLCNFYPRPPRGGRPVCFAAGRVSVSISIHALREEGDAIDGHGLRGTNRISIHALREEGDPLPADNAPAFGNFYPRPPRGGRLLGIPEFLHQRIISIHALREEGDRQARYGQAQCSISIHALREEGDVRRDQGVLRQAYFYPRPPRGGRPPGRPPRRRSPAISIHALREEGDIMTLPCGVSR